MKNILKIAFICALVITSCKKQNEWLDARRQITDNVPKTLKDFQAIMDNNIIMNGGYPTIGLLGTDSYYIPDNLVETLSSTEKNSYLWNKDIFGSLASTEYTFSYIIIANANIILERVEAIDKTIENIPEHNNVKGQALFFRSMMFSELASVFCMPYDKATAISDPGICIRTKSDIHHIELRSSIEKTYSLIIGDLKLASTLLPVTPAYRTRPCKPAAFALLARTYLQMGDYENARDYSDSALTYANNILDYNSSIVSILKPYRFPDYKSGNPEVIFYATGFPYVGIWPNSFLNKSYVDSSLYRSYEENDLRKTILFAADNSGKAKFRGSYSGNDLTFSGIGINEIYFIRAECNARLNNVISATQDLNKILTNRYKKGTYSEFVATSPDSALVKILEERRKEFPFTGQIRWQDLRRLNKEPSFVISLKRTFNGVVYELLPNNKRYAYPFPQGEIDLTGIQQNER